MTPGHIRRMVLDEATENKLVGDVAATKAMVEKDVLPHLIALNGSVADIKREHYRTEGAIGMLRWILITGIAVAGIVGGFIFTQIDDPVPVQIEVVPAVMEDLEGG